MPRTRGLKPRWEQQRFTPDARKGTLLPVVTPSDGAPAGESRLQINQDASLFVAALEPGRGVTHSARPGRRGYVFAISGALELNGVKLDAGDQARITGETKLTLEARAPSEFILIDLP